MNKVKTDIVRAIKVLYYTIKVWFGLRFLRWYQVNGYDYGHTVEDGVECVRMDDEGRIHRNLRIISMSEKINTINKILAEVNKKSERNRK